MARRFFYASAGLFLLMAAYQLGVRRAEADWNGGAAIAGLAVNLAWDAAGQAYAWHPPAVDWQRSPGWDLPVDASQVQLLSTSGDYGDGLLVTTSGQCWYGSSTGWTLLPPLPTDPVTVQREGFGAVKSRFR